MDKDKGMGNYDLLIQLQERFALGNLGNPLGSG